MDLIYNFLKIINLFSEDFAGKIYEKFLESRFSKGRKRLNFGIYYTHFYLVDYIVNNTVRIYLKDKSLDEILKVRIIDPSCGSGRFLIKSFKIICKEIEKRMNFGERSKKFTEFKNYKGRLSLTQKLKIFENCIYGIDLDKKAILLIRFNFLIRFFGKSKNISKKFTRLFSENIQNGNALIDNINISSNAFLWKEKFDEKFDLVIGGPPYGAFFSDKEMDYLDLKYNLGSIYSAILFMALGKDITKKNGINSMIVPKNFLNEDIWGEIRRELFWGISEIVDCGKAWDDVHLEEIIYIYNNGKKLDGYGVKIRKGKKFIPGKSVIKEGIIDQGFLFVIPNS